MKRPRVTIAGMMAAVVFAAFDSFLIRAPDRFAGVFLVALALQVGFFLLLRSHCRRRLFWAGFEATGLLLLLAYVVCDCVEIRMNLWPFFLFKSIHIDGILAQLSPDAALWFLRHISIDINGPLRVIDIVVVFEASYGLPMVLLATVGGLSTAFIGTRGARRQVAIDLR